MQLDEGSGGGSGKDRDVDIREMLIDTGLFQIDLFKYSYNLALVNS